MPAAGFANSPGSIAAWASINGLTDAIDLAFGIASIAVTTTKRLYRVTLNAQAQGTTENVLPIAYTYSNQAAGRMLRVLYVSAGVYDVAVVDSTGAAADATGEIIIGFLRGPRIA